jgi:ABC-type transport system substrate-binding protein
LASVYWFGFMPDQALLRQIHSEAAFNCPRYSNPVVDELIEKARGQDLEGQKETYAEMQRILIDDVPRIVPAFQPMLYGARANVRDANPHPYGWPIMSDAWLDD